MCRITWVKMKWTCPITIHLMWHVDYTFSGGILKQAVFSGDTDYGGRAWQWKKYGRFSVAWKGRTVGNNGKILCFKKSLWRTFTNPQEKIITRDYSLQSITGKSNGTYYNWDEKGSSLIGTQTNINITLNPHESKLLYISTDGAGPGGMTLGGK